MTLPARTLAILLGVCSFPPVLWAAPPKPAPRKQTLPAVVNSNPVLPEAVDKFEVPEVELRPPKNWKEGLQRYLYAEFFFEMGFSKPQPDPLLSASPSLLSYGMGTVLGGWLPINIPGLKTFAGLLFDYRYFGQMSEVDPALGNFRGKYFQPLSPTVGAVFRDWLVRVDFEFLGNYQLLNKTTEGAEIAYTRPLGFRAAGFYTFKRILKKDIRVGLQYEELSFGRREITGFPNLQLDPKLSLSQLGIVLAYGF